MKWNRKTTQKLGVLGSLYLSQGLPFGFFTGALPVLMRKQGYSLETIGLTTMLALPWALKFLWAPLVDRYGWRRFGQRRSWILPLQAITVFVLFGIAVLVNESKITMLFGCMFVVNLLAATQDIATDGLAVDILSPAERGLGNGIQVAGYRLGMIIGGGVLLIFYEDIGWTGIFFGMAVIILIAGIPVWCHREAKPHFQGASGRPGLLSFFTRPGVLSSGLIILVYKAGDAFATAMLRPFLVDRGMTLADVGWLLGTVGFVAGLLGALVGGGLVNSLGRKRSLVVFGLLQAATISGYAFAAAVDGGRLLLYGLCGAEHFAGGMATAALFTCMMDWCRPGANATDYTVYASLVVIATGLTSALSGFSAGALGYVGHFCLAATLGFVSVWIAARLFPKESGIHSADISPMGRTEATQCV